MGLPFAPGPIAEGSPSMFPRRVRYAPRDGECS